MFPSSAESPAHGGRSWKKLPSSSYEQVRLCQISMRRIYCWVLKMILRSGPEFEHGGFGDGDNDVDGLA